ncbi:hypothetical protein ABZ509_35680, partial [Streptomyces lavendulocolor]
MNTAYDVVAVFCGGDGRHGNPLGVVRDGRSHPDEASRQAFAKQLGFSETVFVDDPEVDRLPVRRVRDLPPLARRRAPVEEVQLF